MELAKAKAVVDAYNKQTRTALPRIAATLKKARLNYANSMAQLINETDAKDKTKLAKYIEKHLISMNINDYE